MLPKKQKINTQLFDEVFKKGKTFHSNFFYLKTLASSKQQKSKFAFTIPKKVIKTAVGRNTLKRKGFAILKENKDNIIYGFLGIFFAKKEIKTIKSKEFEAEIKNLLESSKLLKK